MEKPRTCGQGLAAHALIPELMGQLTAALADNLALHIRTLDGSDPATAPEREAYESLARQTVHLAGQLAAVAREMAGYLDLPMGRHDPAALASSELARAFEQFVRTQSEVVDRLGQAARQDEQLLNDMRGAHAASPAH
jgi:hypothetical protein